MIVNPDNEWNDILKDHPIFSLPKSFKVSANDKQNSLELSTNTLPQFVKVDPLEDGPAPSGRRQTMLLKDADLIVAAGKEIRIASLGDAKSGRTASKSYKTLHTPNVQFEIHQISLNPNGKLLAVAGAFQVAVIVLPRAGFTRLVPETVDCKSVQIGQFYHAAGNSAPVAKVDWHPWGEGASTLLVMTGDGKLREYDISIDTEEPLQVLSFVPERKSKSYLAEDTSEREVASFALGQGRADWGPLTIYALMKSGDIYAICPYLPQNASVPSSYIHSLECFISAKQEFLAQGTSATIKNLSTVYDYQHKYVSSLLKQLPPGTVFPAISRSVPIHPPKSIKPPPARQGPFLLQPAPRILEGSEGGDATDIAYLSFVVDDDDDDSRQGNPTEHLGIVTVAYQDGKVDLFLDVEKVEARWEFKNCHDLPMLAVYETIDLGLVSTITSLSNESGQPPLMDLLQGNHPVFLLDPIHNDTLYVYHAFGVHALYIGPVLQNLAMALRDEDDEATLDSALQTATETLVQPLLTTFSVEKRCSNPIIGVAMPNDVYLSYSILILTSTMRISVFPLTLRSDAPPNHDDDGSLAPTAEEEVPVDIEKSSWLKPADGPPAYVSMLKAEPYKTPSLSFPSGLPTTTKLALPSSTMSKELVLTPDTLRYLGRSAAQISSQINDVRVAYRASAARAELQQQELKRLVNAARDMITKVDSLNGPKKDALETRLKNIQDNQSALLTRLDRLLIALSREASPELSEHETKWFQELGRMKQEVLGVGKYDNSALVSKTRQLEKEYARIIPSLKALVAKENERKRKVAETNSTLGFSQAFDFGQRSNIEITKISSLEEEIVKLAARLDVTLEKPRKLQ